MFEIPSLGYVGETAAKIEGLSPSLRQKKNKKCQTIPAKATPTF